MLLAGRLRRSPTAAAAALIRPIPSPTAPFKTTTTTTTTSSSDASSSVPDPEAVAAEAATLLSRCSGNWKLTIASSDLPSRLSPAAISLLLCCHSPPHLHPKLLLDFLYWSRPCIAPLMPTADSLAHLAVALCAGPVLPQANGLLDRMFRAYPNPPLVLGSVHCALSTSHHDCSAAVLDVLVDTYKKARRARDTAEVVLLMKDLGLAPSLHCCNALLKDLLRADALDLLWKVRGFEEMRVRGCSLNAVTYNVLIGGLCRSGAVEEVFGFKKEMEDYGLVPDGYTYGALINGLCKRGMLNQAKCLLGEMSSAGIVPNVVVYATLLDGFTREGNADEAFQIVREMTAAGVQPYKITYDNVIRGLCKLGQMGRAAKILKEMVQYV